MQHGSPIWQTALFFAAILFLLWQLWRGWHAGLARSGMHFAAIFVSLSLGCLAAKLTAVPLGGLDNLAGFTAGIVVGGALGIFLFVAIWILGAMLFKRTEHQGSSFFRLFWGGGGALFGLLIGLAILWGGVAIVRTLGAFAESRAEARLERPGPANPGVADGFLALKESLELGSAGRFLASVDAFPPDFYELVLQIGKLTNDEQAMLRFLQYPGLQKILENPRIVDLVNDPTVVRASNEKNVFLLLGNKAVAAAVADPILAEQLRKLDLRAALKFALESPPRSQAPSQAPSPTKRR
jgi:hypothetical protein